MTSLCTNCASAPADRIGVVADHDSAACRRRFRELLARGSSDLRAMQVHSLAVDAWRVQHPRSGDDDAAIETGVHLISLYAQLVLGASHREAKSIRERAGRAIAFRELPLPDSVARFDVSHALDAACPDEHAVRVRSWARSVWQAWYPHHAQVMSWARRIVDQGRVAEPPRRQLAGWYAGARNIVHPT